MKGLAKRNNKTRGKTVRRRKSRGKTARRRKTRGGDGEMPEWLTKQNCEASLRNEHTVPEDIGKDYFQEMCRTELKLHNISGGKKRKTHKKRK
jgi:hypothetical protein